MLDSEFTKLADKLLFQISEIVEQKDINCSIDIDYEADILSLTTVNGIFIINKKSVVKEIWLSSPISGPYHFKYLNNLWISKKGDELFKILTKEFNIDFNDL